MEEENQVVGRDAEANENNINLESEDFCFYIQNKEEAKKNLDKTAKEWTDYVDSLIKDVPDPSDEEIKAGIEKILARAYPGEKQPHTEKANKNKRVTLKVLFIAAVVSLVSVCGIFAVGNSKNISIENGFMAFARETVQVVFFGKDKEDYISVDALLTNLEEHGYGDILFPSEFITNSDDYKVSLPEYRSDDVVKQVAFDVHKDASTYKFCVYDFEPLQQTFDYTNMGNAQSVQINDLCVYVFEFDSSCVAEFINEGYRYYLETNLSYSEIVEVIKTIK